MEEYAAGGRWSFFYSFLCHCEQTLVCVAIQFLVFLICMPRLCHAMTMFLRFKHTNSPERNGPDLRRGDDIFVFFVPLNTSEGSPPVEEYAAGERWSFLFFLIFFKAPRRRMGTFYLQNLNTVIPAQAGIHCFMYSFVIASKRQFA